MTTGPTLLDRFLQHAATAPDALALDGPAGRWSYRELQARADELLRELRARGAAPGAVIGLCLQRSPNLVAATVAVTKLGAAYLCLDHRHPVDRLHHTLAAAGCQLVIADGALLGLVPAGLDVIEVPHPERKALPGAAPEPAGPAHPDAVACIFYTSGSAGRPKGVAVTRRNITALLDGMEFLKLGPADRVAHVANPAFDAATFEIWAPLTRGAAVVVGPPQVTAELPGLLRFIEEYHVSTLFLTSALFRAAAFGRPGALHGLRHLLFGGEVADAAAVARIQRESKPDSLVHVYGPTETTTFATAFPLPDDWSEDARSVPIGTALPGLQTHVLDGLLLPVAAGTPGELFISGDTVARGYLGAPGLTAERFLPDPFAARPGARMYRTGDVASRQPNGALDFLGRVDSQVKIRGNRIELAEVEITLARHGQVAAAAAAVWEPEPGDRRLVALLVPVGSGLDIESVRAEARARLPDFMVPAHLAVAAAVPLTSNGKVDRAAVATLASADLTGPGGEPDPRHGAGDDSLEALVRGIWEEVLRCSVGTDQNFFDVGGDSLLLLQVHARLEEQLGRQVPLADLLEFPTVTTLAAALRSSGG